MFLLKALYQFMTTDYSIINFFAKFLVIGGFTYLFIVCIVYLYLFFESLRSKQFSRNDLLAPKKKIKGAILFQDPKNSKKNKYQYTIHT